MSGEVKKGRGNLRELAALFLRLGVTAFGGPAAHIAMMHDEAVVRRKWLGEQQFLDLIGATNLIPGPNSTEMAIHLGFMHGGWRGLVLAGVCFILPAALIVTALTWLYVEYGTTAEGELLFYGIKPVMIAIILQALYMLGRRVVTGVLTSIVGIGVIAGYFLGVNEILLLVAGGLIVMAGKNIGGLGGHHVTGFLITLSGIDAASVQAKELSLTSLFLIFLKIGSVLYGSGYVLLAFLESDLVNRLGWLTTQQLIDAVSIGQVTPGPVFTTATSIGFILAGLPEAAVATLGIFIPSFIFVAISNPMIPRIRKSPWAGGMLDGVNAASLGLMAAVTFELGRVSFVDPLTVLIGLLAAGAIFFLRVNSTWLVLGGGIAGLLSGLL
ncbi:MAG: chromate efflux transporter [Deltaproteobacteria bacterium]